MDHDNKLYFILSIRLLLYLVLEYGNSPVKPNPNLNPTPKLVEIDTPTADN